MLINNNLSGKKLPSWCISLWNLKMLVAQQAIKIFYVFPYRIEQNMYSKVITDCRYDFFLFCVLFLSWLSVVDLFHNCLCPSSPIGLMNCIEFVILPSGAGPLSVCKSSFTVHMEISVIYVHEYKSQSKYLSLKEKEGSCVFI